VTFGSDSHYEPTPTAPRDLFAHLALALARHEKACARDRIKVPAELITFRALLTASASLRQDPTPMAVSTASSDAEPVTDKLLMTKRETAALLGVSVRTVERLVTSGSLSPVQVSRSVRFLRADLDTYLAGLRSRSFRDDLHTKAPA